MLLVLAEGGQKHPARARSKQAIQPASSPAAQARANEKMSQPSWDIVVSTQVDRGRATLGALLLSLSLPPLPAASPPALPPFPSASPPTLPPSPCPSAPALDVPPRDLPPLPCPA